MKKQQEIQWKKLDDDGERQDNIKQIPVQSKICSVIF
jgi:hypothetical protein